MLKQLGSFILQNKKWWLLPPLIIFILLGILVAISTVSPIGPFTYMLF